MRLPRYAWLAVLSLFSLAPLASAQDSHYWTNQYGARATLLGGAVIGSVIDLSATYYNPGGLSLIDKPETLIAAKVLQLRRVDLVGGGPQSVSLHSFYPGPAPSLLAGTIRIRGLRKHSFGYSYVARQDAKLSVSVSEAGATDVFPEAPGREDFVSQFRIDQKLSEHWFGLTWSYKAAKHIGIGVTQYLALRSHWSVIQESLEARSQANEMAMAFSSRQFSYLHLRTLWKIGLAADFKDVTLGLTLTTPSLAFGGHGTVGLNYTQTGLDADGDGDPDDSLAAIYRKGLRARFKTPFSVAAGMTFKIRKVRVYWSAEWFASLDPYTVVNAGPLTPQSGGAPLSTAITQEVSPVLNFGLGFEWLYSSRFKGYAGFTTDYSSKRAGSSANMSISDWDVFHFVTGSELKFAKSSFTFGIGYSFGNQAFGERPALLPPDGFEGTWDPLGDLKFRYVIYKLIVGFAF